MLGNIAMTVYCDWVKLDGKPGVIRCSRSGCSLPDYTIPIRKSTGDLWPIEMIHRPCRAIASADVAVPLYRLWWNFAWAWVQHAQHGFPVTPEHARAQRLAICKGCEFYVNEKCKKCGCGVKNKAAWLDKLGWADQRCPVGKWGPVVIPRKPWGKRGDAALSWLSGWLRYLSPYETL